jgi:putative GTP pyrophosphokinase
MAAPFITPNRREIERNYEFQRGFYDAVMQEMEQRVKGAVEASGVHPVLKSRVKTFHSYFGKLIRYLEKASLDGNPEGYPINDIIAMRVICPFLEDLTAVEKILTVCFFVEEIEHKGAERSYSEFGYNSIHVLIRIPEDIMEKYPAIDIRICEVQIRTILQEAWAEVEHELVYKARFDPKDDPMRRKLAAMNANLSLSDLIFQDIRDYQRKFMDEMSVRRDSFYEKVESEIDADLFGETALAHGGEGPNLGEQPDGTEFEGTETIDDLLLQGLQAHNQRDYMVAVRVYTEILAREAPRAVKSLVFKHRGMVFFAQSKYQEAEGDFSKAMEFDQDCYKAAYYRGVVRCVETRYAEAIRDFDTVLRIHPCHFYTIFRRAEAYYHLGDYPKALSDCENALGLEPDDSNAGKLREMVLDKLKM